MSRPARRAALRALPLFLAAGLASVAWAVESAPTPPAAATEKTPAAEKPAADPLELGRGLRYFRFGAGSIDDAAFAAAKNAPALVVDLRSPGEDIANLARLRELLATRDAARPLFVLLGADTPTALRAAIPAAPGVLTLAGKDSGVAANVVIAVEPARDRAAAAALAAGRAPRELVEEKIEKTRFDEARLARNHANGHRDSDTTEAPKDVKSTITSPASDPAPTPSGSATEKDAKPADPAAQPAPPHDLLLQRAVFLHRALLALGRIPEHT